MSPLSSRRVRVALAPRTLHGTLSIGWPRRRVLAESHHVWDGAPHLVEAFDALMGTLAAAAPTRGATLDVEISNACAHFDVAEGRFAGHSDAQLDAVARACVAELLGDAAAYDVRWTLQIDNRHLLICAVDKALVESIQAAAHRHALRLRFMAPAFGRGWARHGAALDEGLGVLAFTDEEQALVALVRDGVVEAVSTGAQPDGLDDPRAPAPDVDRLLNGLGLQRAATPTRLDAQVERLVTRLGLDMGQIERFIAVVDGPGDGEPALDLSSRWQLHRGLEVRA